MVVPSLLLNARLSRWLSADVASTPQVVPPTDATGLTRVNILAYTGGLLNLEELPLPVVFDLSSTVAAASVVMLYGHDRDIPIGHFDSVKISKTEIVVSGPISIDNEKSQEVKSAAKNGYPWQASVGLESDNTQYVAAGETVTVNGQSFTGPMYVARENTLREVSILSIGADPNTRVSFSAKLGATMTFEEWVISLGFDPAALTATQKSSLEGIYNTMMAAGASDTAKTEAAAKARTVMTAAAPVTHPTLPIPPPVVPPTNLPAVDPILDIRRRTADEHRRIQQIQAHAAIYGNPVENGVAISVTAIEAGWTVEQAELRMLRASRPNNIHHGAARTDGVTPWQTLHAALAQTTRRANLDRSFTPQVLDAAHREYRGRLSLQQLLYEAARINGYTGSVNVRANLRRVLQAAFSTMELVDIFTTSVNVKLLEGYNQVDQTWRTISAIGTANDFKEFSSFRISGSMNFEKLPPDGMIPHGRLSENDFGNKVDTYAKMYAITRQDIYNDDMGALDSIPRLLGRGGALGLVRAFWVEFMNNSTFFASGNGNVSTGALGLAGLAAAEAVFRGLKGEDGNYIMGTPKYLLVPTVLMPTAEQLYVSTNLTGGSAAVLESNNLAGKYQPLTSPYLSDTTITGNSTTAYYLLADPSDVPVIEVAFLDGQQTPIVETADVDFNQLGIQMRGYWDWGVRKQDPKGGVRSTGV